ncbi:MAG: hypothetical protein Q4B68_07290 [Bacteroidales bacterium]|nr:hypothetical protein [Bacteroidales bacterium]
MTSKHFTLILLALMGMGAASASAAPKAEADTINAQWQRTILAAVDSFPHLGGYYTGGKPNALFATTTWQGLHAAFQMGKADAKPRFCPAKAQPSFCSSATYAALVKALIMWDKDGQIGTEAWRNMKPYVGIADELNPDSIGQNDGEGFWGRANANGPSIGVLVHELKAGFSHTAFRGAKSERNKETPDEQYLTDDQWRAHPVWAHAVKGDFMKIFWDRNESRGRDNGAIVGCNDVKGDDQEAGHSVIFMGYTPDGKVTYWSSNGPGKNPENMGYSIATCDKTDIQRVVFTRITHPERFDAVKHMHPKHVNQYLYDLNGKKHSTTAELKAQCGIKE